MISQKVLWVAVFAVAFALVESAVVVYLRSLYYPEGFSLPLRIMSRHHFWVELSRELATLIMLASVGVLAGTNGWQKFAYFMIAFGVWDIFYYVWLKVMLNWPDSPLDWDVLFLIPVPWIGPVIAPFLISILMVSSGVLVIRRDSIEQPFRPQKLSWILSIVATLAVLISFLSNTQATLNLNNPRPYSYELLALGLVLYSVAMFLTFRGSHSGFERPS